MLILFMLFNVNSVTPVQTGFENPSQTSVRISVVASMKNLATFPPQNSEISGIDNTSTFTGTPTYSESEGEGSEDEDRYPSSESSHRIHTESCLDNFVPMQLVDAKQIPRAPYKGA